MELITERSRIATVAANMAVLVSEAKAPKQKPKP